jgi:peptidoglycan-N-acetylmuramic acid deacetylase
MILNNLHNGGILLLHAISRTNVDILDDVLKEAKNMGYTFELFE